MRGTRAGFAGRRTRAWLVAVAGLLMVLALTGPAAAQDGATESDEDEQVVLTGGLVVPEGETVGTVVVFNGPVEIEGTVTDSVVVALRMRPGLAVTVASIPRSRRASPSCSRTRRA